MMRKLTIIFATVIAVLGASTVGWFLGFRDGISRSSADVGLSLAFYHQAIKDGDLPAADKRLNTLTRETVVHLLNARHRFPLFFENPYRAQNILGELRATWDDEANLLRFGAMKYPHEPATADYAALFKTIRPVLPEKQISLRKLSTGTEGAAEQAAGESK